jgi:hypothetical protein
MLWKDCFRSDFYENVEVQKLPVRRTSSGKSPIVLFFFAQSASDEHLMGRLPLSICMFQH